jgi:hypothetical protein
LLLITGVNAHLLAIRNDWLWHPKRVMINDVQSKESRVIVRDPAADLLGVTVVDRLTKMAHFIPMTKRESAVVARLFLENVWKYHRLPFDILSDRNRVFTGHFITDLYQFLGITQSMSTAFLSQTDGQTECLNQTIEHFLRTYCNYKQDNWREMLAIAEYVYNISRQSTTKITPFYANYHYEPWTNWPTETLFKNAGSEIYAHYMVEFHRKLENQLKQSGKRWKNTMSERESQHHNTQSTIG